MKNQKTYNKIESAFLKCKKCAIHKHKGVCFGDITEASIMIIAQNPGWNPDKKPQEIIPFGMNTKNSEYSGKILLDLFHDVGINRDDVYITNIIKCCTPQNRPPEKGEIKNCLEYLKNEIKLQKPKTIILLGTPARITFHHNQFYYLGWEKSKVISIWHPAYILRNRQFYETWVEDFREQWERKK